MNTGLSRILVLISGSACILMCGGVNAETNCLNVSRPEYKHYPTDSYALGDRFVDGEIVPWAKIAVGANDMFRTDNRFYMVDRIMRDPIGTWDTQQDLPYISREVATSPVDGRPQLSGIYEEFHPTFVAGLVGAQSNYYGIRGINPGQMIMSYGYSALKPNYNSEHQDCKLGHSDIDKVLTVLFDKLERDSENNNEFAVLNISSNATPGLDKFQGTWLLGYRLRRLSNRFFITQSAGNSDPGVVDHNACNYAYSDGSGNPSNNDGIMVVGGVDRNGDRFLTGNWNGPWSVKSGTPVSREIGQSKGGKCVEIWAPGQEITSLSPDGGTFVGSGTSFSAPIVAAIASRYGDSQTRPVEREWYIRAGMRPTGKFDNATSETLPINMVQYVNPGYLVLPKRIPVVNIWSPTNSANLSSLTDGKYFNDFYWNANANSGSVTIDLGAVRNLTGLRITMVSSYTIVGGGVLSFNVFAGNDMSGSGNLVANYTEQYQADRAPVFIDLNGVNARYVRIDASNNSSWLAYSEIEAYGY